MTNYVILSAESSSKLDQALSEIHYHMRHPKKKRINYENILNLMKEIKEKNASIQKTLQEKNSFWVRKATIRIISIVVALSNVAYLIVAIMDYAQSLNESNKCIEEYNNFLTLFEKELSNSNLSNSVLKTYNSFITNFTHHTFHIPNHCKKDNNFELWKFMLGILAAIGGSIGGYANERRKKIEDQREELLLKFQSQQEIESFNKFISSLQNFIQNKDKPHFDECVNQIQELQDNRFFRNKIGSKELITSYLINQVTDTRIQKALKNIQGARVKPRARRRLHRTGEGASLVERRNSFSSSWDEITRFIGYDLDYLKIGDCFIRKDGFCSESEEDMASQAVNSRPIIDIAAPLEEQMKGDELDSGHLPV